MQARRGLTEGERRTELSKKVVQLLLCCCCRILAAKSEPDQLSASGRRSSSCQWSDGVAAEELVANVHVCDVVHLDARGTLHVKLVKFRFDKVFSSL